MNEKNATLDDVVTSVDRLTDEGADIRAELRRRTRALWVAITVGAILVLVFLTAAVAVSVNYDKRIEANNLRWCPVVLPLAPRPGDPKPAGSPEQVERALRIRSAFSKLVDDFGCR
jgi:hypothetical protein